MDSRIRVAILDDYPGILDGYRYRLGLTPEIEIVSAICFGDQLEPALLAHPADVLLLDLSVPSSPENPNPYPVLPIIPHLLQKFPSLAVLVISMYADRLLIRSVMEAGASGYLLKNDQASLENLGQIVLNVAYGGIHLSEQARKQLLRRNDAPEERGLSKRQVAALWMAAAYPNESTAALADRMGIAHSTMRNLLSSTYVRLEVSNRAAAIAQARQIGLLTQPPVEPGDALTV